MESGKVAINAFDLEKPVHVVAIAQGYYGNRIIEAGQRFKYEGRVKRNRRGEYVLPLWTELDETVEGNEIKVKGKESSKPVEKAESKDSKKAKEVKDLL